VDGGDSRDGQRAEHPPHVAAKAEPIARLWATAPSRTRRDRRRSRSLAGAPQDHRANVAIVVDGGEDLEQIVAHRHVVALNCAGDLSVTHATGRACRREPRSKRSFSTTSARSHQREAVRWTAGSALSAARDCGTTALVNTRHRHRDIDGEFIRFGGRERERVARRTISSASRSGSKRGVEASQPRGVVVVKSANASASRAPPPVRALRRLYWSAKQRQQSR